MSRYNHVSHLGNWQGDPPTIVHAFTHVPQDAEWSEAFYSPPSMPTLVADRGYVPTVPFPFYYASGDGWRNTLTDVLWDGVK